MNSIRFSCLCLVLFVGCRGKTAQPVPQGNAAAPGPLQSEQPQSLPEARKGFQTRLTRQVADHESPTQPPANLMRIVKFDAPGGKHSAYLTLEKKDGRKHPAIIWITGGDCNGIDEGNWKPQPADNDQSARAFREKGIVMMYPSLRGGNDSPGVKEGFFGEVEDVLAAAKFLAKQPDVDQNHIYLGGHSTGGTMVLLVAAYPNPFRAVFSFGPAHTVRGYPPDYTPFDTTNVKEVSLRSPLPWLNSIKTPVFVFEGTSQGNLDSLQVMQKNSKNPLLHFFPVRGTTHFSILLPITRLIADKILADAGSTTSISFGDAELSKALQKDNADAKAGNPPLNRRGGRRPPQRP